MSDRPHTDFWSLFKDSVVPVIHLDDKGGILNLNSSATRLINAEVSAQPASLSDLLQDSSQSERAIKQIFTNPPTMTSVEFYWGDGKGVHVRLSPLSYLPDGSCYMVAQDISELNQTRVRLVNSENRFRELIQNSSLGLLEVDEQEIIRYANSSFCTLTGYSEEELLGKHAPTLLLPGVDPDTMAVMEEVQEKRRSGVSDAYELRIIGKGNKPIWVLISGAPLFDDNGRVTGSIGIHHDITFSKQAESNLRNALNREAELNGLKTRFITLTSHEFRTPLTTIQSSAELLSMALENTSLPNSAKVHRYINRITSEVTRLTNLMNDILVLGRIDAGRISVRPEPVDLPHFVNEFLESGHFLLHEDRIPVMKVKGVPQLLEADPGLLTHIFQNLITNALKYSPGCPPPEIILEYKADRCKVCVSDFGIGIPKEDQKDLFHTFFRASNVENIQGTGLGLTIVKQFIELHGSTISVESAENEGTCFSFELYLTFPKESINYAGNQDHPGH